MSDIILPGGESANRVKRVLGRRLKRPEQLFELFGQLLFVRDREGAKGLPFLKANGYIGLIQCVYPDPLYPGRAGGLVVLGGSSAGVFGQIPVEKLEASDPWCHPPGFPEMAVSLLEE